MPGSMLCSATQTGSGSLSYKWKKCKVEKEKFSPIEFFPLLFKIALGFLSDVDTRFSR